MTTGIPGFMIPAFSLAIFSRVFPRSAIWSKEIFVITEAKGVIMFVESRRPPSPTSITAISTWLSAKYLKAIATVISKKDGFTRENKSAWCRTKSMTYCSLIISPLILILSRKSFKWGEVYRPVLYPACCNIEASMWDTDPLPFVPATWIVLKFLWGCLKYSSNCKVLSRFALYAAWPSLWYIGSWANNQFKVSW